MINMIGCDVASKLIFDFVFFLLSANVYRFVAGSASNSVLWCKNITEAIQKGVKQAHVSKFDHSLIELDFYFAIYCTLSPRIIIIVLN